MNFLKNFMKNYHIKNYNFALILMILGLSIIGILSVGSALPSAQPKQILGVVIGLVMMVIVSLIDYEWLLNFYWGLYGINIFLLLWVKFFGVNYNGAQRWIDLKFTTLQPSDLTKIITILFFAKLLMDHETRIKEPKTIIKCVLLILPSLYLIVTQPNLSNTICIAALFCILLYLGGLSYKVIGTALAIAVPAVIIVISIALMPNQKIIKGYQQERILAWLNPEDYSTGTAWQQQNSIMAIGSGQLEGKGLNNNTTTSVKNGNFLLESETDFIFAIIGEEMGFVGCCIVIILILLIIIQCIRIGMKAQNLAGQIICGGVAGLIGIQSFINIGVATGTLPNTGLSLPFVSAGLTSIVCFYMGIGFVLNVGLQPRKY